jgi:malonyl-CoA O-methyltransferase
MNQDAGIKHAAGDAPDDFALGALSVRRSFDRAGAGYDAVAVLQTDVRERLLQRLDLTAVAPRVILDAGAGTGHASHALKRGYPDSQVIALDSAFGMLRAAGCQQSWVGCFHRVCADAEHLPLPDASVDLIFSSLMLQWCDLDAVFAEFRRALAPGGCLRFTSLGPDTLHELRAAWASVDSQSHVNRFINMHDVSAAMVRAGFAAPVLDVERYTLTYAEVRGLAADLKAIGAHNVTAGRPNGLTGPRKFTAMQAAYETFRREGRLPATYEVIFGQA